MHIRLTAAVGSFASRPGLSIEAVLIAPVKSGEVTILPEGSILLGQVTGARRVGLGMVHETSSLTLDFTSATVPGGSPVPLSTRVTAVDNARETVSSKGTILLGRSTGSLAHRASNYVGEVLLLDVHAELTEWLIKSLVTQLPEPEIYLPAGAELTLELERPLAAPPAASDTSPRRLTNEERDDLAPVIAELPQRTFAANSNRPSDLVNVLLIGSREQVSAAFTAAGWTQPRQASFRAGLEDALAVMENRGVANAPMSTLLLDNLPPEMSWQKSFNDIGKRHHIRLWRHGVTAEGRQIWIGAATRDVDLAFFRSGSMFTHKVDAQVDHERDKIAYDLAFTSCADALDWWARPEVPRLARNATGDLMETDDRLVVVRLNSCSDAHTVEEPQSSVLPVHGGRVQRAVRREILSARSDLIRGNPYWQAYEGVRYVVVAIRGLRRSASKDPDAPPRRTFASRIFPARLTTIVSPR